MPEFCPVSPPIWCEELLKKKAAEIWDLFFFFFLPRSYQTRKSMAALQRLRHRNFKVKEGAINTLSRALDLGCRLSQAVASPPLAATSTPPSSLAFTSAHLHPLQLLHAWGNTRPSPLEGVLGGGDDDGSPWMKLRAVLKGKRGAKGKRGLLLRLGGTWG